MSLVTDKPSERPAAFADAFKIIAQALVLAVVIRSFLFQPYSIPSSSMENTVLVGDYVFVHAGVRPGVAMEQQNPSDLLWIREEFLRSRRPVPGKVVVHGHTICEMPEDLGFRIDIDTGAYATGRLTCLVLRGSSRRFLMTAAKPPRLGSDAREPITQS